MSRVAWLGLRVAAVAGMLALAIVGLGAATRAGAPFQPRVIQLPPTLVAVLLVLGLPLMLVSIVLRAIRSRRDSSRGSDSVRRWLMFAGLLLLVWLLRDILARRDLEPESAAVADQAPASDLFPAWSTGVTGLVVALLAVAAGLLLWRRRRTVDEVNPAPPSQASSPAIPPRFRGRLAETFDEPRDQLLGYYAVMEAELAAAGSPRQVAETQSELTTRTSAAGLVPPIPAAQLTSLYLSARYSEHPVPPSDLESARSALAEVQSALHRIDHLPLTTSLDEQ